MPRHAAPEVMNCVHAGRVVDPEVHVLVRRVADFRRCWFKAPELRPELNDVWADACAKGHP
eukprot:14312769-Alexandrium_andersonii.AAC.1